MTKTLMLCDCGGSQTLDRDAISKATGLNCSRINNGLCTSGLDVLAKSMSDGDVIIACMQEVSIFDELADELERLAPVSVDIRDRAGWSEEAKSATPKIAALVAEAQLTPPARRAIDVESDGLCLVIGQGEIALAAAEQLAGTIDVTCLITEINDITPASGGDADILVGTIRSASGSLGKFSVQVDGLRSPNPSGRGAFTFSDPKNGAKSECDVILNLSGNAPLFPAHEKRDGYLRADPGNPLAVAKAVYEASHMEGTFEKPLYVSFDEQTCAHSRASQSGCNRCLDVCPTGAILSAGDAVSIDPNICAGCGSCAAVCPSGAVTYIDPPANFLFQRLRTLSKAYLDAGGKTPRLLVHDPEHGREMISLAARFGRGLPADVIPFEVSNISGFGHAEMLVALASGFVAIDILTGPKTEMDALTPEMAMSGQMLAGLGIEGEHLRILNLTDPDALCETLYTRTDLPSLTDNPILPLGGRREATRLAVKSLAEKSGIAGPITLPEGAQYGAVLVNTDSCTLCLSCASLCPTGALADNPDKPQLRFQEDACLQCGICVSTCPENAISLVPQFDFTEQALSQKIVHEEEPFACIECGKLFGVKSTIDRIVEKLDGNHSMFTNSDNTRLIKMCDDCRVSVQFQRDQPMFGGERNRVRTTDDYLKEKKPN